MWGIDWSTLTWLLVIGLFGGILSGSLGVGGGVIMVPAMVFLLGMSQHEAQGTYLGMMIPPLAAFSAYNYWKAGHINWDRLSQLIATNPAKILGEKGVGAIEEGYEANLILFDPNVSFEVSRKTSPYFGKTLYGNIVKVFSS